MKLNLVDRRVVCPVLPELVGEQWSRLVRLATSIGGAPWQVNVVLVEDEEMAAINRQFRGGHGVTDVLSFSYLAVEGSGEPHLKQGCGCAPTDLWTGDFDGCPGEGGAVGEIVLAPDFVVTRCRANLWAVEEEFPLLLVHGCLHLVGWDHEQTAERAAMRDHETRILAAEGLPHPLRQRS